MLIQSPRHTAADLDVWRTNERTDSIHARMPSLAAKTAAATACVAHFAEDRCYVGVSWGKDSVVVAHLASSLAVRRPLVWVRVEPMYNPDCLAVRDAFLRVHDVDYDEIVTECGHDVGTGRLVDGFAIASRKHGDRYVSGVRGSESGVRAMRMRSLGTASDRTCAPIGWWSTADVFAYLHAHDLPVHPAYAMTGGGLWQRDRVRVASIGGERGRGHGRADWEARYYPSRPSVT